MLHNLRSFREEVIWAAALIDGEGSIGLYDRAVRNATSKGGMRTIGIVQCSMTHRYPLLRLKRLFGGTVYRRKRLPSC